MPASERDSTPPSGDAGFDRVVRAYFARVNREDYAGVGELFAPQGTWSSPDTDRPRGAADIPGVLADVLAGWVEHRDDPLRVHVDGAVAVAEIRFAGLHRCGLRVEFEAVDVFDLDGSGRIVALRSWYDTHRLRETFREHRRRAAAPTAGRRAK